MDSPRNVPRPGGGLSTFGPPAGSRSDFPSASRASSTRAGQESLQITRVQNQGGGSVEVQLLIPYDRNTDWSQVEKWYQRFHVEDDAGHKFQDHGRGSQSNGNQYWISLYYGPPNGKAAGPPTKLIFEDWVVHEHAIPFEFRDVPLP